jgi:SulP family sulfate permease
LSDVPADLDLIVRGPHGKEGASGAEISHPEPIQEVTEALTPAGLSPRVQQSGSSALTAMIRNSPPNDDDHHRDEEMGGEEAAPGPAAMVTDRSSESNNERTSLIRVSSQTKPYPHYGSADDFESQTFVKKSPSSSFTRALVTGRRIGLLFLNPKTWERRKIWEEGVVHPTSLLPAVLLGLLLNILDALSYGMILFPLGQPVFAQLGSEGISMFYVSTIIAQLVFSCGGSAFKGGVGSEMIEVVPFFHKMAFMILNKVGEDDVKSVLATTILSYAVSSILTGTVFFLMGACGLGSLIGFFPRHILIGCIGGVGWFLVVTGLEVSARLSGNLEYDLATLHKLFQLDTVFLWTIPLALGISLLVMKRFVKSNFLVGGYFLSVGALFYIVKFASKVSLDTLRGSGWVFEAPSSSNPWYHFYTLYGKSHWHMSTWWT